MSKLRKNAPRATGAFPEGGGVNPGKSGGGSAQFYHKEEKKNPI